MSKRYQAQFEGWLTTDHRLVAKGPFLIEIIDDGKKLKPHWVARVKPTNQSIAIPATKIPGELQAAIGFQFQKQLTPWEEVTGEVTRALDFQQECP